MQRKAQMSFLAKFIFALLLLAIGFSMYNVAFGNANNFTNQTTTTINNPAILIQDCPCGGTQMEIDGVNRCVVSFTQNRCAELAEDYSFSWDTARGMCLYKKDTCVDCIRAGNCEHVN